MGWLRCSSIVAVCACPAADVRAKAAGRSRG